MNIKISTKYILLIVTILLFITGCKSDLAILEKKGTINDSTTFEFRKPTVISDNYMLNLEEDKEEFFVKNLVEATGFIPVSSVTITINNELLFDIDEMYEKENYKDLILRRGYLECDKASSNCVVDHRTGYDVDFYVKGHEWTDFKGNKEADNLIENSYKYGLVLRYTSKDDYQPWHYRYVGKTHAMIMHSEGLTIDQYIKEINNWEPNKIFKIKNTSHYIYKTNKKDVIVPVNYNYSISSISKDYYVIDFDTNKTISLEEIENKEHLIEKDLKNLNVLYELILVNNDNAIANYSNTNMVSLTKYLTDDNNPKYLLDEVVLQKLKPMLEESDRLDRHVTYVTSAYRSVQEQQQLYDNGEDGYVQKPGYSEHHTGFSFDLSNSYKPHTEFTTTAQGLWIQKNAHKYGFINRYPIDKVDITGIEYEPWHFRYVGEMHATYIKENNLTLEEYLDTFKLNKFYEFEFNNKKYIFYKTKSNNNKIKTFEDENSVYYIGNDEYLSILK